MAILAKVVNDQGLVPQETWQKVIGELQNKSHGEGNKEKLKEAIIEAVRKRIPRGPFGIFFSGGVDSTLIALICKQLGLDFTCYTVGFQHEDSDLPQDILYARKIAKELDLKHVEKLHNVREAKDCIKEAVRIFGKPKEFDVNYFVTIDVASVVIAARKIAKENIFFSGLGSEEIFAGYNRHAKCTDVNAECWNGLKEMWGRDLFRDVKLGKELGIELLVPFLDQNVIVEAMKISGNKKINDEHKKIILRQIAEEIGLPKEYAWRKKQGAQYGSRFDKAIEKLAKMNDMNSKREYIESLF